MMDPDVGRRWEEFLDPDNMRPKLITASIFIAAFELLKSSIVDRIADFYRIGLEWNQQDRQEYEGKVLSRNRSTLYASLDWLADQAAISDEDLAVFERVKQCRNTVAHELLSVVGGTGALPDFDQRFEDMVNLLKKIETWWIREVEMPTDPDLAGQEIDEKGIVPGSVLMLQVLCDIALGDQERSRFYLDGFRTAGAPSRVHIDGKGRQT